MKLNKLKKKCISEFFAQHEGTHKTPAEVGAKFDKKIKKKKYKILKDRVKLIPEEPGTVEDSSITEEIKETKVYYFLYFKHNI